MANTDMVGPRRIRDGITDKTRQALMTTLWVWLSIFGIVCLIGSYFAAKEHDWGRLFESLGIAIIVCGMFDVFLKSVAYLGVFRDALKDIFAEPSFQTELATIVHNPEVFWKAAVKGLFLRQFPELSALAEHTFFETYFPPAIDAYYDQCRHSIYIKPGADEGYLSVKEVVNVTIRPASRGHKIIIPCIREITKVAGDKTSYHLVELIVNDVDKLSESDPRIDSNQAGGAILLAQHTITLEGADEYRVYSVEEKYYSLKVDNAKSFASKRFINSMECDIYYPPDLLDIRFMSVGTKLEFTDIPEGDAGRLHKKFLGLLFPYQGYRFEAYWK